MADSIYVFYGAYSGELGYSDAKLYQKAAHTLFTALKRLNPHNIVSIHRAFSKQDLIDALMGSKGSIKQVHIVCNCDSQGLHFEGTNQWRDSLSTRATKWIRPARRHVLASTNPASPTDQAMSNLEQASSLLSGYLSRALDPSVLKSLRQGHAEGANWHLWGGNAGDYVVRFGDPTSPIRNVYLKQFNTGPRGTLGVAVDIAKSLCVSCVSAQGTTKWRAFRATPAKKFARLRKDDRLPPPIWLWPATPRSWIAIGPNGTPNSSLELGATYAGSAPPDKVAQLFWQNHAVPAHHSRSQPQSKPEEFLNVDFTPAKKTLVSTTTIDIKTQNPANTRAFFPDVSDKSGISMLRASIRNVPSNASYLWTAQEGHVHFNTPLKPETEITALKPGTDYALLQVWDAQGRRVAHQSVYLSVPQFVLLTETGQFKKLISTEYKFDNLQKTQLLQQMKQVVDPLLKPANVRVIWQLPPFNENLPKQFRTAPGTKMYTHARLKGRKKSPHELVAGETILPTGPDIFNETINLYPGAYIEKGAIQGDPVRKLWKQLGASTDPHLFPLWTTIIARLTGNTLAHEIYHSLIGVIYGLDAGGHNLPFSPPGIMDSDKQASFEAKTAIQILNEADFPKKGTYAILGISQLVGLNKENRGVVEVSFPVPPEFT